MLLIITFASKSSWSVIKYQSRFSFGVTLINIFVLLSIVDKTNSNLAFPVKFRLPLCFCLDFPFQQRTSYVKAEQLINVICSFTSRITRSLYVDYVQVVDYRTPDLMNYRNEA